MGCGMSTSHLRDEGVIAFGYRNPFHNKTDTASNLLINHSSIAHHPPVLQKINTVGFNPCNEDEGKTVLNSNMWFGSPSFREYIHSSPDDATKGDGQGKETGNGGRNLTCNQEVCIFGDSNGKDKKDIRGVRFRKVFQVHRVTFWHGGPWHVGHPKAIRKPACRE